MSPEQARYLLQQPDTGSELLRESAARLFVLAEPADVELIWRAKQSSFDAACSIDSELLCGPGLDQALLQLAHLPEALEALRKLSNFNRQACLQEIERYYGPDLTL